MQRAIEAHLESLQVARVIYGAIVGLALVVALEQHPPSAVAVAASLLATALAVALAELYSEIVAARLRHRRGVPREHTREIVGDVVAVAFGAGLPGCLLRPRRHQRDGGWGRRSRSPSGRGSR